MASHAPSSSPSPPGVSTAGGGDYVRTCQACVVLKMRCARKPGKSKCERCYRTGKECVYRKARRRPPPSTEDLRIDALEAKLDRLFSTTPQGVGAPLPDAPSAASTAPATASLSSAASIPAELETCPGDEAVAPPVTSRQTTASVVGSGFCTEEEAETRLEHFKTDLTPHFPFVIIDPSTTAARLGEERPFLLMAIVAASSYEDMPLQKFLSNEIKAAISNGLIMGGDSSMELLQGLLVYLAWTHYQPRPRQHSQWLHLALSIAADLSLDKPPVAGSWKTSLDWHKAPPVPQGQRTGVPPTKPQLDQRADISDSMWTNRAGAADSGQVPRSLDEYRAVLGCYYLASSSHIFLQKRSPFPFSPYLEDVGRYVSDHPNCSTDKYLVHIIKLQEIMERIDKLLSQRSAHPHDVGSFCEIWSGGLRSELEAFKQKLPFPVKESYFIFSHINAAELYLYQICLPDRHFPDAFGTASWDPWRIELLQAGFVAAKSQFEAYFSLCPGLDKAFSNLEWMQLGFVLLVFAKLSVAAAAEPIARHTIALRRACPAVVMLWQAQQRVEGLISAAVDSRGDRDAFYHFALRAKEVRNWYERNFDKAERLQPSSETADSPLAQRILPSKPATALNETTADGVLSTLEMPLIADPMTATAFDDGALPPDMSIEYFIPDAVLDEIMMDWPSQSYGSFEL